MTKKYIAYYRVSTQRQGQSGLGLEAQQEAVKRHLGNNPLIAEITEIESGKRNDRPKLTEALRLCRVHKATLVIAKLDRLSRNLHFISSLMEAKVEFQAVDCPHANKMTLQIMAVMAEHEADAISVRTKAALAAAKARGVKLGGNRGNQLNDEARMKGCAVRRALADERAADLAPIIQNLQASGVTSYRGIAMALNAQGVTTARQGQWSDIQVARVLARLN